MTKRLLFTIHGLHKNGGMERSTLEIASRMAEKHSSELAIEALVMDSDVSDLPASIKTYHLPFPFRRPFILRELYYYFVSTLFILFKKGSRIVHATGTCSLLSNVVQVQFCHHAWLNVKKRNYIREKEPARRFYHELLDRFECLIEKMVYTKNKTYIAISESVARDLRKYFSVEKIHIIHHGTNIDDFSTENTKWRDDTRRLFSIDDDIFLFLFVGAFQRKGLDTVLRAMKNIENDNCHLLAIGSGEKQRYIEHIRKYGLEKKVTILDPQPDIQKYFAASDAFVFPTLYEPFGLVITEAMTMELPVITTSLAGASELISNGETGMIVDDPADADDIASKMKTLVDDRDFSRKMGKRARKAVSENTWDRVSEKYADVIRSIKQ